MILARCQPAATVRHPRNSGAVSGTVRHSGGDSTPRIPRLARQPAERRPIRPLYLVEDRYRLPRSARKFRWNQCASGPFSPHADQTVAPSFMCADGGLRRGGSPGSASAGDTPGSNGPAVTRAGRQLRTDATGPVLRHGRARANHNRPADRAAGRQTGPVGRRAVPASGSRSGHARTCAGYRQHAGDPAARQPRRRPHGPAEITPTAANTLSCAELLELLAEGAE